MKIKTAIVGCEESQVVCKALREQGVEAYSCDLLPCSGGRPEWHIQGDILEVLKTRKFDLGIFHPPCTYLAGSGERWFKDQPPRKSGKLVGAARRAAREKAVEFFMVLVNADIKHIAVENPIGIMSTRYRKPDQIIQPWMFGHGETKATCLWLKNLQKLIPTNIVEGREQRIFNLPNTPDRSRLRSVTYTGIAASMAKSWTWVEDKKNLFNQ